MRSLLGLAVLVLVGCSNESKTPNKEGSDDAAVKQVFVQFQTALKKSDGTELWKHVDEDTRQDADRAAKSAKALHAKGSEAEKGALEKKLGLSKDDVEKLTGATFLGTKLFADKYHEIAGGQAEKVEFPRKGTAKLIYFDPSDNDREDVTLVQEQGVWKLRLKGMPRLEN